MFRLEAQLIGDQKNCLTFDYLFMFLNLLKHIVRREITNNFEFFDDFIFFVSKNSRYKPQR